MSRLVDIFITTCARHESFVRLCDQIESERGIAVRLHAIIDGFDDEYWGTIKRRRFATVTTFSEPMGKRGYWRIYSRAFDVFDAMRCDDISRRYMCVLQDDILLADDAITKAVAAFDVARVHDPSVVCLNLFRDIRIRREWWMGSRPEYVDIGASRYIKTQWLDGQGWIARSDGLPTMVGRSLKPVDPTFWSDNCFRGSGVFHQLSDLIYRNGKSVYVPFRSLIRHDIASPSIMHAVNRPRAPIFEANFDG